MPQQQIRQYNTAINNQINALNTNVNNEYGTAQTGYNAANAAETALTTGLQNGTLPAGNGVNPGLQAFLTNDVNPWETTNNPGQPVTYNFRTLFRNWRPRHRRRLRRQRRPGLCTSPGIPESSCRVKYWGTCSRYKCFYRQSSGNIQYSCPAYSK